MHEQERGTLDDFIESALKSERLRAVPPHFHRTVVRRVQVAVLVDRERRRFRRCVGSAVTVAAVLSGVTILAALGSGIRESLVQSIPGALGMYDQFVYLAGQWWPSAVATTTALAFALALAGLVYDMRLQTRRQLARVTS